MLRISRLTDYATVLLARLAADPARQCTAAELALATHIAQPTVSKLLKQLHRNELLISTRGLRGGYRLARPASAITAAHILDALEDPLGLTECSRRQCEIEQSCRTGLPGSASAWRSGARSRQSRCWNSRPDGQPVFPAAGRQLTPAG
jgi:FeS assembly SUF system regulator